MGDTSAKALKRDSKGRVINLELCRKLLSGSDISDFLICYKWMLGKLERKESESGN